MPTSYPPARATAEGAAERQANQRSSRLISDFLALLQDRLSPVRRLVRAGDCIYKAGDSFDHLHVLNTGVCKLVTLSPDGREQMVGLKFRGDWLGFDGMSGGAYTCDAIAMDTGEVWRVPYESLLAACTQDLTLLRHLHAAMSDVIAHDRESLMSVCTLPADARVAEFLRYWADSLAKRGQRADEISLRMTRAEIGNHLGMTLETVSRALSRLARDRLIGFATKGRREVQIPSVPALSAFVQRSLSPASVLQ